MSQVEQRVVMVALADVVEGDDNYRKTFEEAPLAELTESVKANGVLTPILVRPTEGGTGKVQVVAGFRRVRACRRAGLSHVPAICREMNDEVARHANLLENLFRVDPHPLDEADAFHALLGKGHTVDTIAGVTGKPRAYVLRRLQLLKLGKSARKAFQQNKILVEVATMLATITDREAQNQAATALTVRADPMGVNEARALIDRNFRLRLKDAPFPTDQNDLVAGVPSCNACPRRTGSTPDLFGASSDKDLCTDRRCFDLKVEAGWTATCEEALAKGEEVLDEEESKKLFTHGTYLPSSSGFVDLGQQCLQDSKLRTWGAVLGKVRPPVIHARDKLGRAHQLCREEDAREALVYLYGDKATAAPSPSSVPGDVAAKQKEERAQLRRRREVIHRGLAAVAAAAEKAPPSGSDDVWRHLAAQAVDAVSYLEWGVVGKVRGMEGKPYDVRQRLMAELGAMTGAQAFGLLVQILSSRWATSPSLDRLPPALSGSAHVLGVDLEAVEKAVEAEAAEKVLQKAEGAPCSRCSKRSKRLSAVPNSEDRLCPACSREEEQPHSALRKAA
ncbi:ParB/RepB/Spo0J family partition protein [Myxococcus sp. MISCRS1]|uniref:ParB/RepB/Spo0J family partition protein n=1 Tax=Myxococcus sp. MISCRS1 TaxID=2996786 RepID=UPI0022720CCA|nr:ParB/RepB/Spo0J family partition protein [Myxococcus sp. MISCRS1]MCY1003958.1 ParB/RepB/Spo0J family partition protein [Myxococcus sp. MISCRS1]